MLICIVGMNRTPIRVHSSKITICKLIRHFFHKQFMKQERCNLKPSKYICFIDINKFIHYIRVKKLIEFHRKF